MVLNLSTRQRQPRGFAQWSGRADGPMREPRRSRNSKTLLPVEPTPAPLVRSLVQLLGAALVDHPERVLSTCMSDFEYVWATMSTRHRCWSA